MHMKTIMITYTTTLAFAEENQSNIKHVMSDLRNLADERIDYTACLCSDGKTFIHTAIFKSDEGQKTLNDLPSFIEFQKQLKSSGLESPPKQEILTLVGSSKFNN